MDKEECVDKGSVWIRGAHKGRMGMDKGNACGQGENKG